jgi:hypothetical protein
VACWYVIFGLLVVPYRLLRRGSRKRKKTAMQHREGLAAVNAQGAAPGAPPAAAGWYPDPRGRFDQRYFDGTAWTDHVYRGTVQSIDPQGA